MRTPKEELEFDLICYGMSEADVREHLEPQAEMSGRDMLVMCMLSDAQEMLNREQSFTRDEVRQLLNRAKWVLSKLPQNDLDKLMQDLRKNAA